MSLLVVFSWPFELKMNQKMSPKAKGAWFDLVVGVGRHISTSQPTFPRKLFLFILLPPHWKKKYLFAQTLILSRHQSQ